MKKALYLILMFTLLLSSLTSVNADKTEAKGKEYTGQELFEGIFFGYGEVGDLLSEFWETALPNGYTYSEEEIQKIKSIEDELINYDSEIFNNLKKGIESKDPVVVEEAIAEVEKGLAIIFEEEIAQEKAALEQEQSNSQVEKSATFSNKKAQTLAVKPGFVLWAAYSYVGATHIAAAITVFVVAVGTKVVGPSSVEADNLLSREMYIDSIAENLN